MEYSSALMHNINGDVPIYPDRILFAEDLVNYIINSLCGIVFRLNGAERFRENTYNAFNEIAEEGVDKILVTESNVRYDKNESNTWDKDTYFSIAAKMEKIFLKEGLEPSEFRYFCVHVTLLARDFISNGLWNAANLASIVIYASLLNYDMFLGGWDSLNSAAENIFNCDDSLNTPNSSSPGTSESDSQHRITLSSSLDGAELRSTDNDESQNESTLHASVSEDSSISNEEKYGGYLQVPDISTGTQNRELIHDFKSSEMREEDEPVAQQEDVKDELKVNEPVEDKYLREFRASATGKILEQACERQKVVSDNESSKSGETHDANMHETSSTIIDGYLFFEYMRFRALASLIKNDTEDN